MLMFNYLPVAMVLWFMCAVLVFSYLWEREDD